MLTEGKAILEANLQSVGERMPELPAELQPEPAAK
jgi:hypothetical protein